MFGVGRIILGWGIESLLVVLTSFIAGYYRDGYFVINSSIKIDTNGWYLSMGIYSWICIVYLVCSYCK